MDSFSSNFQEILTIMTDPTSYTEYKSSSGVSRVFRVFRVFRSHTICMNYDGIDNDCNTCRFSWYKHQDKYDEMKIDDCGNFSPHPACTSRCSNCIFNNTHHKFSKKFHSLNSTSKDKIRDLWSDITADFIDLSETDRLKYLHQYKIIDQMLTNRLYTLEDLK
jgi:hypothetical protein